MQRFLAATIFLLGACTAGPPSHSDEGVVRRESAARAWRASGQLIPNQTAYDPVRDRFFIATRDGSSGPLTPRLFDVATGRITDLSFDCPGRNEITGDPDGSPKPWNGMDPDFRNPDSGAVFLPDDRIAYSCGSFGIQFPPPTNGKDMAIGMIFVDQPLSPAARRAIRRSSPASPIRPGARRCFVRCRAADGSRIARIIPWRASTRRIR